jgi:predicted O-methyltransferase YrrM
VTPTLISQLRRDIQDQVNRKVHHRSDLPWMKSKELDILSEVLDRLGPARCLEWGAGASTAWFAARLPGLEHWLAIEHDAPWFETVHARIRHPALEVVLQPPDREDYRVRGRDGTLEDFRTYVTLPEARGERYDFILVDGRARSACLDIAFRLLDDRGVVALHDANREAYRAALPPFGHRELFTDWRKNRGGLLLASKGRPIREVLDVDRHRRLWSRHDLIAKTLFLR